MSTLFTKDGSNVYSYDENLNQIACKNGSIRGIPIGVDNGILFTKDGTNIYSYDKNLNQIACKNGNIKGISLNK